MDTGSPITPDIRLDARRIDLLVGSIREGGKAGNGEDPAEILAKGLNGLEDGNIKRSKAIGCLCDALSEVCEKDQANLDNEGAVRIITAIAKLRPSKAELGDALAGTAHFGDEVETAVKQEGRTTTANAMTTLRLHRLDTTAPGGAHTEKKPEAPGQKPVKVPPK